MGANSTSPYSTVAISGYNATPPSDDGAQTSANQLSWSKHKLKIGDPLKTLAETINTNVVSAFAKSINTDADVRNQISGSLALDWATATIGTDAITPTYSAVLLGTESGATSDTLQRISATGVYQGALLYIRQRNASEEILLVHATSTAATATGANIYLANNADRQLQDANKALLFCYDGNVASGWVQHESGAPIEILRNSRATDYTFGLSDSGRAIFNSGSATATATFTIPANSSVAFPIGTAISVITYSPAGIMTLAITSDVLRFAGATSVGSRTLTSNSMVTIVKMQATEWIVSGSGIA